MKVKAKALKGRDGEKGKPSGVYDNNLRYAGDDFVLTDKTMANGDNYPVTQQFSERWMVDVEDALEKNKDGTCRKVNGDFVLRKEPLNVSKKSSEVKEK